ncbi:winged helix-turn-helix transcriptional regulator [Cellulomonas sp. zg-ZUI199]|uniref:Winged helix-turn-helix transcriptional regulator n=1 Tax=Cellulomonas wangleii TaxID=2816956 RepID=A0ABX8D234_9CELL|nr:winged helix-turn-helix transcriptional regulator [Cellulomonas wangleii]QVI61536.1 winged helix-turn-helix transcriptional regulator [Cellulomonas wangleii]
MGSSAVRCRTISLIRQVTVVDLSTTVGCRAQPLRRTPVPDDVRWLSATQQRDWRAFRDGTALLFDVLGRELDEGSGLSLGEYEVLVRLSEAPRRALRMSELADDLAHSRSRLTHTVARMERAGIVRREPALDDARGVNCVLTDHGWQVLVAAAPGHVESVRRHLVDVLDDAQLAALGEAMRVVVAHLRGPGRLPDADGDAAR